MGTRELSREGECKVDPRNDASTCYEIAVAHYAGERSCGQAAHFIQESVVTDRVIEHAGPSGHTDYVASRDIG